MAHALALAGGTSYYFMNESTHGERHTSLAHQAQQTMSTEELIHAYRKLFRAGLRAVKFSKPARFVVRDQLRAAFREGNAKDFDPDRVKRTVWFLTLAGEGSRLEHKIVQNLVRTQYTRQTMATSKPWRLLAKRLDDKKVPT